MASYDLKTPAEESAGSHTDDIKQGNTTILCSSNFSFISCYQDPQCLVVCANILVLCQGIPIMKIHYGR